MTPLDIAHEMVAFADHHRTERGTADSEADRVARELLRCADRDELRDDLVKWRRWADSILGGPGLMSSDKEARDEIKRRIGEMRRQTEHP